MIRVLRALTWLRWRLLVNSLRGAERRDTLERASRVAALVVPGLMMAGAATAIVGAAVAGVVFGWMSVTRFSPSLLPTIRVLLLVATVFAAMVPLFVGTQGGTARFSRLLLLPIRRRTLHAVEVVTGLADPWLAYLLPGLTGFAAGILAAALFGGEVRYRGRVTDGLVALAAGLGVAFALASLSSLVSFVVSWLVRDRRRSEIFVVVIVLALSVVSIVPALVSSRLASEANQAAAQGEGRRSPLRLPGELPAWTVVLPSELYYQAVRRAVAWPRAQTTLPLAALFLEGALLFALSAVAYRKRVESTEGTRSARRRKAPSGDGSPTRIPGFWPGTSAIAMTQARTALRSVRGRLVVLLPGPLIAMLVLLFRNMPKPGDIEALLFSHGHLALLAGIIFGLYAGQAFTMNQFGSDRAGLTLQFLQPIRDVDIVRGKAVGCAMVMSLGAAITLACSLAVAPGGSPFQWLATLAGGLAAFLILSPMTAWFSAILPVASDLSKTGAGGNPHSFAMFAGTALVALAVAPTGFVLTLFSPPIAFVLMCGWLMTAAIAAYLLLGLVARTVKARKENLVLVAQGR